MQQSASEAARGCTLATATATVTSLLSTMLNLQLSEERERRRARHQGSCNLGPRTRKGAPVEPQRDVESSVQIKRSRNWTNGCCPSCLAETARQQIEAF